MNKENLRKELDELKIVFQSAKYYELDFRYIYSVMNTLPVVYSTFHLFIDRTFHSSSVLMILNLNKLFDEKEESSLLRFKSRLTHKYQKSELRDYLEKSELDEMIASLYTNETNLILSKIKTTRNKYYAHLDKARVDFSEIKISSIETGLLISKAEMFLRKIELKYFGIDIDYNLTINELGHNIFERLDEWEIYREKYGNIR